MERGGERGEGGVVSVCVHRLRPARGLGPYSQHITKVTGTMKLSRVYVGVAACTDL